MGTADGEVGVSAGSTSGIGARTAEVFVAEGARVVIAGRREEKTVELAKAAITAAVLPRYQALPYVGTVDDIAQPALFLASDASGLVSGHDLVVDGGISA